jgi:hypothetical protein
MRAVFPSLARANITKASSRRKGILMSSATVFSPSAHVTDGTAVSLPGDPAGFILGEILRCNGPQLPCYQERSILAGFLERFTADEAALICHQAFGVHGGMWRQAPVTVLRFSGEHDSYFAIPLLEEAHASGPGIR